MNAVTDVDRKAAEDLRELLADISGFWFKPGDLGPLCAALARHREQCEAHLLEKMAHCGVRVAPAERSSFVPEPTVTTPFDPRQQRPRSVALRR